MYEQSIVTLDVLAFAAAIAMVIQAFKAHRAISSRTSFAFLACFSLIGIGLFSRMLTDVFSQNIVSHMSFFQVVSASIMQEKLLLLIAALCILSGYTILLLVVENIQNKSMWVLVFLLVIFTIFLANNVFVVTHVLAIVLLSLLAYRFYANFLRKGSTSALLVYLAFLFLSIAHIAALFVSLSTLFHIAFLSLRLLGYFTLFGVSWRVTHG